MKNLIFTFLVVEFIVFNFILSIFLFLLLTELTEATLLLDNPDWKFAKI